MRFCSSASGVTDERVADRPSDRRERRVKPLLGGVLVWGFKQEVRRCSLISIRSFMFLDFFVAPISAFGPATDGRAVKTVHLWSI